MIDFGPYSLHPGFRPNPVYYENLLRNTGRTLEEWVETAASRFPEDDRALHTWLMTQPGFSTNYARWVMEAARGRADAEAYDPMALVAAMFAGPKQGLLPLYNTVLKFGLALGSDVRACPCSTIVPLYRRHVFAQLKPSSRSRLDLGLALKGEQPPPFLIETGGAQKGDRITHRFPLSSETDFGDEAGEWMRRAYTLTAPGEADQNRSSIPKDR
jgi:hypothetical protein